MPVTSIGVAIDKNGHVFNPSIPKTDAPNDVDQSPRTHASAIFLRSEITVCTTSYRAVIPAELSMGVQLRIASLALFRALVKNHTDAFFDAANNTPVGNVRPHVISLFFRSLVSNPPEAVAAAYAALRDVLTLSAQPPKMLSQPEKETAEIEGEKERIVCSSCHPPSPEGTASNLYPSRVIEFEKLYQVESPATSRHFAIAFSSF